MPVSCCGDWSLRALPFGTGRLGFAKPITTIIRMNESCVIEDVSGGGAPLPAELALVGIVVVIVGGLFRRCYSPRVRRWLSRPLLGKTLPAFSSWLDLSRAEFLGCAAVFITSGLPVVLSGLVGGYFETALLAGTTAEIALSLCLAPATRTTIWVRIFGISFDRAIMFHRWLAWWAVASANTHFLMYLGKSGSCVIEDQVTGFAGTLLFTLLSVLSLNVFRRRMFELFRVAHWLFLPAFFLIVLHTGGIAGYAAAPTILYVLDRFMRWYRSKQEWTTEKFEATGAGVVHLTVRPAAKATHHMAFEAGQFCFIRVPAVSKFEWHPFSICSAPEVGGSRGTTSPVPSSVSFAIKSMGSNTWSGRLLALAESGTVTPNQLEVRVDGAFGHLSYGAFAARHVVLVGGGIGATPLISILEQLMHNGAARAAPCGVVCDRVTLVWVVRDVAEFAWCQSTLVHASTLMFPRVTLQLHVTGKGSPQFPVALQAGRPDIAKVLKQALAGDVEVEMTNQVYAHASAADAGGTRRINVRASTPPAVTCPPESSPTGVASRTERRPPALSPTSADAAGAGPMPVRPRAYSPTIVPTPDDRPTCTAYMQGPDPDPESVVVLASGPGPLVDSTKQHCSMMGLAFHHESFLF